MDPHYSSNVFYDYRTNYNHYQIHNMECNLNIIQGPGGNYSRPFEDQNQSHGYPTTHKTHIVIPQQQPSPCPTVFPSYNINNEFVAPVQSQILTEIYPNNLQYNYQNHHYNNPSGYSNEVFNTYPNTMKYSELGECSTQQMGLPSFNNCQTYPTVNYNFNINSIKVDNIPEEYVKQEPLQTNMDYPTVRKMHENCTTLYYNRKSSSSNDAPRKFQYCYKAYMKNSHLKAHMRLHSGEKPHICQFILPGNIVCNEAFSRSDQLTRHRRKHTNERPFRCLYCEKSFYRSDHCGTHQDRCKEKSQNNHFSIDH